MRKIRTLISKMFYPLGLTINILTIRSSDFAEIKETALRLKVNNDLRSYSKYMNKLSGQKFKRQKFIGHGGGLNTTQTHAIVEHNGEHYFEKVFDVKSRDYLFLKTHYSFYQELLAQNDVKIPVLIDFFESEHIAVCHFEYLPKLEPLESGWIEEGLKTLAVFKSIPYVQLQYGKKYTELNLFNKALTIILHTISNDKDTLLKFLEIKKFVENQNMVFTHGDFYVRNVFKKIIIDWDDMGFYPFGIDMAFLMYNDKDIEMSNVHDVFIYLEGLNMPIEEQIGTIFFILLIKQVFSKITYQDQIIWINEIHDKIG